MALVENGVAVADALYVFDAAREVQGRSTGVGSGTCGELFAALGNDALDFFFVGGFVHVDVHVGRRFRHDAAVFWSRGEILAGANVEEERVFERVVRMAFA